MSNCEEALEAYGKRFGDRDQAGFVFDRQAFPWSHNQRDGLRTETSGEEVRAELGKDPSLRVGTLNTENKDTQQGILHKDADAALGFSPFYKAMRSGGVCEEDSDGEVLQLCQQCNLPLGDVVYSCMHGECMGNFMLEDMRRSEKARLASEREKKDKRHAEFGIGWNIENIPRNKGPASKLAMHTVPEGMICLVIDESTGCIRIASTMEPAASMNLEYLSIALTVRRREGTEPMFSLDPISNTPEHSKHSMQEKVFEPGWLAGTQVGEVLFQADYHLKELSMGEYDQPVVGMKSCFDLSRMEEEDKRSWSARTWFVVRKAEVQICNSDVLIPCVKLGVEAREQVLSNSGVTEDKPVTRPDHPMVKFAEAFTQNFELIAERKSVIYNLREVAKASVLAKYLLDTGVRLEQAWFSVASKTKLPCTMEIPQLWNERIRAMVAMKDGTILNTEATKYPKLHGIYGGVEFGLDKFNLSTGARSQVAATLSSGRVPAGFSRPSSTVGRPLASVLGTRPMATQKNVMGPVSLFRTRDVGKSIAPMPDIVSAAIGTASAPGYPAQRVPGLSATPVAAPTDEQLQGVDLRLDSFDLSSARHVSLETQAGGWGKLIKPLEDCINLSEVFWSSLDAISGPFKDSDKALLRSIFNPCLSDRRAEADRFVPPDASYSHVEKLRTLVKAEDEVRQRRKKAFCSKEFAMTNPGRLFPSSWTSEFELACDQTPIRGVEGRPLTSLTERFEYCGHAIDLLQGVVKAIAPEFDKSTEDGMCFRIYRLGTLEVRTVQETNCEETVGIIFSLRDCRADTGSVRQLQPREKITKVTEYVERAIAGHRRYYVVMETESGQRILTERSQDGHVIWEADPEIIAERSSLARVTRTKECASSTTVHDLEMDADALSKYSLASPSMCKHWARSTYWRALGQMSK